jgi:hypothetical protein
MVQITERDEAMVQWLDVVRLADLEAVRWALGSFAGAGQPLSLRRAQLWVARMMAIGWLDRSRPTYRDGSIVWATRLAIGKPPPSLFRQTTRHEVAVATVSARYLAQGFAWRRDRQPAGHYEHQADGVATRDGIVELVEVELTPKSWQRYQKIVTNHAYRLVHEDVDRVAYFCTADAHRAITRDADTSFVRRERPRLVSYPCLDARGIWIGPNLVAGNHAVQLEAAMQLDGTHV